MPSYLVCKNSAITVSNMIMSDEPLKPYIAVKSHGPVPLTTQTDMTGVEVKVSNTPFILLSNLSVITGSTTTSFSMTSTESTSTPTGRYIAGAYINSASQVATKGAYNFGKHSHYSYSDVIVDAMTNAVNYFVAGECFIDATSYSDSLIFRTTDKGLATFSNGTAYWVWSSSTVDDSVQTLIFCRGSLNTSASTMYCWSANLQNPAGFSGAFKNSLYYPDRPAKEGVNFKGSLVAGSYVQRYASTRPLEVETESTSVSCTSSYSETTVKRNYILTHSVSATTTTIINSSTSTPTGKYVAGAPTNTWSGSTTVSFWDPQWFTLSAGYAASSYDLTVWRWYTRGTFYKNADVYLMATSCGNNLSFNTTNVGMVTFGGQTSNFIFSKFTSGGSAMTRWFIRGSLNTAAKTMSCWFPMSVNYFVGGVVSSFSYPGFSRPAVSWRTYNGNYQEKRLSRHTRPLSIETQSVTCTNTAETTSSSSGFSYILTSEETETIPFYSMSVTSSSVVSDSISWQAYMNRNLSYTAFIPNESSVLTNPSDGWILCDGVDPANLLIRTTDVCPAGIKKVSEQEYSNYLLARSEQILGSNTQYLIVNRGSVDLGASTFSMSYATTTREYLSYDNATEQYNAKFGSATKKGKFTHRVQSNSGQVSRVYLSGSITLETRTRKTTYLSSELTSDDPVDPVESDDPGEG